MARRVGSGGFLNFLTVFVYLSYWLLPFGWTSEESSVVWLHVEEVCMVSLASDGRSLR